MYQSRSSHPWHLTCTQHMKKNANASVVVACMNVSLHEVHDSRVESSVYDEWVRVHICQLHT